MHYMQTTTNTAIAITNVLRDIVGLPPGGGGSNFVSNTNGFGFGTTIFQQIIATNFTGDGSGLTNLFGAGGTNFIANTNGLGRGTLAFLGSIGATGRVSIAYSNGARALLVASNALSIWDGGGDPILERNLFPNNLLIERAGNTVLSSDPAFGTKLYDQAGNSVISIYGGHANGNLITNIDGPTGLNSNSWYLATNQLAGGASVAAGTNIIAATNAGLVTLSLATNPVIWLDRVNFASFASNVTGEDWMAEVPMFQQDFRTGTNNVVIQFGANGDRGSLFIHTGHGGVSSDPNHTEWQFASPGNFAVGPGLGYEGAGHWQWGIGNCSTNNGGYWHYNQNIPVLNAANGFSGYSAPYTYIAAWANSAVGGGVKYPGMIGKTFGTNGIYELSFFDDLFRGGGDPAVNRWFLSELHFPVRFLMGTSTQAVFNANVLAHENLSVSGNSDFTNAVAVHNSIMNVYGAGDLPVLSVDGIGHTVAIGPNSGYNSTLTVQNGNGGAANIYASIGLGGTYIGGVNGLSLHDGVNIPAAAGAGVFRVEGTIRMPALTVGTISGPLLTTNGAGTIVGSYDGHLLTNLTVTAATAYWQTNTPAGVISNVYSPTAIGGSLAVNGLISGTNSDASSGSGFILNTNGSLLLSGDGSASQGATAMFGSKDTLELRRGTNAAQKLFLYRTYTNLNTYERLRISSDMGSGNPNARIMTENSVGAGTQNLEVGAGVGGKVILKSGAANTWEVDATTYAFQPTSGLDDVIDIGSTSSRVRDIVVGRGITTLGLTNTSLTANQLVGTDNNKALISLTTITNLITTETARTNVLALTPSGFVWTNASGGMIASNGAVRIGRVDINGVPVAPPPNGTNLFEVVGRLGPVFRVTTNDDPMIIIGTNNAIEIKDTSASGGNPIINFKGGALLQRSGGTRITFAGSSTDINSLPLAPAAVGLDLGISGQYWRDLLLYRTITSSNLWVTNSLVVSGTMSARTNTATFDVVRTDFVIDTLYTNDARRATVGLSALLTSDLTHTAELSLYVDDNADGTWDTTGLAISEGQTVAQNGKRFIEARIPPSAIFCFTNTSTSGATAPSINTGSSRWVKE